MKVLVNIICRNSVNKDELINMLECCKSKEHEVTVNLCDYSLSKQVKNEVGEDFSNGLTQIITEFNYEDVRDHERNIKNSEIGEGRDVVIDVESSLLLEPGFIDLLGIDHLNDVNYCCVYSDFYSQTKNGYKVYVHQKSFPLMSTSLPLLAFSLKDYLASTDQENVKGFLLSSKLSKHIPAALCSVINA